MKSLRSPHSSFILSLVLGIAAVGSSQCLAAPKAASAPHDLTPQEIAAKSLPAIVRLTMLDPSGAPQKYGSGVVVGKNLVVTCWHVVNGASAVKASFTDGRTKSVPGLVSVDVAHDVVLLSVSTGSIKPLPLGPIPPLGASVVAIGNPEGYSGTISSGLVSGVRTLDMTRVIQTSAPISPGSSGGALLDLHGAVVGVTSEQNIEGQNLNFAVVSDYVRLLLPIDVAVTVTPWKELTPTQSVEQPKPTTALSPADQQAANDALLALWTFDPSQTSWTHPTVDQVQKALDNGADVNARARTGGQVKVGMTALIIAAINDQMDVVRLLVSKGADVNADAGGYTALRGAANAKYLDCVRYLLDHGADVKARGANGGTVLSDVVSGPGNGEIAKALLDAGADVNAAGEIGPPICSAAGSGDTGTLGILMDYGASVDTKCGNHVTPLLMAVMMKEPQNVRYLVDHGANVHVMDDLGRTPLSEARASGVQEIIDILVAAGAG